MSAISVRSADGVTLRQAAVIAGLAYLLNPVSYAELTLYPKLVIPGNIAQTVLNIDSDGKLFAVAILCYLINFIGDIVVAWALYFLLAPVNRALSLLAALFRLMYTALGLFSMVQLAIAYRLIHASYYTAAFGPRQLQAQVELLLDSFRYGWSFSLIIFAIHLVLLGYLIYQSGYIPKILGILLVIVGFGWMVTQLRPYLYPTANLEWFFIISFGELLFPLWLVIMGWKIQLDPQRATSYSAGH